MILAQKELGGGSQELLLSCPFNLTIEQMNFANNTAGALNVTLWIVKMDEIVANKHIYLPAIPIVGNDRGVCTDEITLLLTDRLVVQASGYGIMASVFGRQG